MLELFMLHMAEPVKCPGYSYCSSQRVMYICIQDGPLGKRILQIPGFVFWWSFFFFFNLFCFMFYPLPWNFSSHGTDPAYACDNTMLFEKCSVSITLPAHRVVACPFYNKNIWATVYPDSMSFSGSWVTQLPLTLAKGRHHLSLSLLPYLLECNEG